MTTAQASGDIIVRKIQSLYNIDEDERQAIRALPLQVRDLRRDQDIAREGDRPPQCCLLLEGPSTAISSRRPASVRSSASTPPATFRTCRAWRWTNSTTPSARRRPPLLPSSPTRTCVG